MDIFVYYYFWLKAAYSFEWCVQLIQYQCQYTTRQHTYMTTSAQDFTNF